MLADIYGYCPMGCGLTLHLDTISRNIICLSPKCPRPGAVTDLLANPETEHIVVVAEGGFSLKHPLRERIEGELLDCPLHQYLLDIDFNEVGLGPGECYRAMKNENFDPDGYEWSFDKLEVPEP